MLSSHFRGTSLPNEAETLKVKINYWGGLLGPSKVPAPTALSLQHPSRMGSISVQTPARPHNFPSSGSSICEAKIKNTPLSTVVVKKKKKKRGGGVLSTKPVPIGAREITVGPHCGHGHPRYIKNVNMERKTSQGREHNQSASVL